MGSLSPWHWAILAVVVILLFGAKKLPDAARSLGKSMRIFKSELREMQSENKAESSALETNSATNSAPSAANPTPVQSQRVDAPAAAPEQGHSEARPA
ncbi:preprotein translocase subunit SecA [Mycobacterium sp. 852002-53434_SCH5985345]|uniref:Sec-independent protein translocase subunit TatA n=1 Tax=unclassified Mycobacterium TaxID=2642494 RepID=UPI0007FF4C49|nr:MULTISPECIES: Sec-independent protein translocase subunit TatA [unclassified Mycobacterium]OBF59013.1 preprotein translocase subunit SecA [Mycobacterium sp. 852002-53434_SCH5985345]OBF78275.1 preprotein translocase subunit SecA [Mycobacterium sp. 852002-51613_SCH5001154]OBF97507.1 preprotein translocase subunit SecA [Mycobacterium sp. 852014-52450_SCH5900713]